MASNTIPISTDMESILKKCGPALMNVLQSKFGCKAVLHGVEAESAAHYQKTSPDKRFSTQLSSGIWVSVWMDDLTTHNAEAVVNAANVDLKHYGGLAQAFSKAGGPIIQQESDKYINTKGSLETGDAIVANPGNLPCKKIIHAVGPCLPNNPTEYDIKKAMPKLYKTMESILAVVRKENLKSVAIPAISSGLFHFPLKTCASVIVDSLAEYNKTYTGATFEVRLVNHDEPSVRMMEEECLNVLGSSSPPLAAQWNQPSHSQIRMTQPSKNSYSNVVSHGTRSTPLQHSFKINNVNLTVIKGHIERQKTCSIVNTISPELNLWNGDISKAILTAAGTGIQKEIRSPAYGRKCQSGDIIVTAGHNLSCQHVYHTICPKRTEQGSMKVLATIVENCLKMTQNMGLSSISIPAIGTGVLGFSKQEVANIMIDAARKFAQRNSKLQMDIYYVIYPADSETHKAFENELKYLRDEASNLSFYKSALFQEHESRTDHYNSRDAEDRAHPYIELTTACDEMLREAKRWYYDMLNNKHAFTIRNNFIQHFGQREFEQLLNLQTNLGVSITVFFKDGCAGVKVAKDVIPAVIEVEAMCCRVQEDFAKEEQRDMGLKTLTGSSRKPLDVNSAEYKEKQKAYSGFEIIRVEKLENRTMSQLFDLKKQQLQVPTMKRMYQRLPAQFCDLLCRVGFQREFAPPDEQKYGAGIYFSSSVYWAEKLWSGLADEEYMYFVEAIVLTGKSTAGSPNIIVPPAISSSDPFSLYDSVHGGPETHVIFNGHQALPEYLITCKKSAASISAVK